MTDKKEVYCHACSVVGGAEMPVYHDEPICPPMNNIPESLDSFVEKLELLAKRETWVEDDNFNPCELSGGNYDDAYYGGWDDAKTLMAKEVLTYFPDLIKQRDELLESLKEIREIYAGMDGFIAETAPEGYQQRIIKQMYEVARNLINKIGEKI